MQGSPSEKHCLVLPELFISMLPSQNIVAIFPHSCANKKLKQTQKTGNMIQQKAQNSLRALLNRGRNQKVDNFISLQQVAKRDVKYLTIVDKNVTMQPQNTKVFKPLAIHLTNIGCHAITRQKVEINELQCINQTIEVQVRQEPTHQRLEHQ